EAVHARHGHVGEDGVDVVAVQELERLGRRRAPAHPESCLLDAECQERAEVAIVVDDEHLTARHVAELPAASGPPRAREQSSTTRPTHARTSSSAPRPRAPASSAAAAASMSGKPYAP